MSPHRKKGRGGGGGKTLAPLPSTGAPAIDSPPVLPCKLSKQQGRSLTGLLSAARKPSITPTLSNPTGFSAKSKLKEKARSITVSNASSRDAFLSVAGLCSVHGVSKLGNSTTRIAAAGLSSSNGVSKSRKYTNSIDQERIFRHGPAIGHARIRTGIHSKEEGKKISKISAQTKAPSQKDASHSHNRSCRSSLHGQEIGESLRWSTMALPLQSERSRKLLEKTLPGGDLTKQELINVSPRHLSHEGRPSMDMSPNDLSHDGRLSMGSSVMSIATSLQSGCEEGLEHDGIPRVLDEYGYHKGISSDKISRVLAAWRNDTWQNDNGADADAVPRVSIKSGKNHVGINSGDISRVSVECENHQITTSTALDVSQAKGVSPSMAVIHTAHPVSDSDDASDHQMPDGISNFSTSLHERLALLEGRVSQIASELKKTKEMLDNNNPSGSVALLSDIQGKISSIERAMSSRLSDGESVSPEDAVMEDLLQPPARACFNNVPTHEELGILHRTTTGASKFTSVVETLHQNALDISSLASRKTDRLETDQQELEDRLFPHRKLLKSQMSLHERVAESRAALHSKLEDTVPQIQVNGMHDVADKGFFSLSTALEQRPCTGNTKVQKLRDLDEEATSPGGMITSNYMGLHHHDNGFLKKDYSTTSKQESLSLVGLASQNLKGCNEESIKSAHSTQVQCVSGQDGPCIEETCARGVVQAENTLHFLECDENLPFKSSDIPENLAPDDEVEVDSDDFPTDKLHSIGGRITTAGWYACEGEAIVLVHDDGCCSFYDVANMEEKAVYVCPEGSAAIPWNDCWLIRAAGSDGRANKYIVAATSGSALDTGFCSWDFHSRIVAAYHNEGQITSLDHNASAKSSRVHMLMRSQTSSSRSLNSLAWSTNGRGPRVLGSSESRADVGFLNNRLPYQNECSEPLRWWYKPCGPLMASAGSFLRNVALYDIRDGDTVMRWDTKKPIVSLDFSSPLQWRNRGKLALAEEQAISIWDVNTMDAQCLQYIELFGKQICAFHLHNADAECSGGVRQRLSSSETEAYDGICCTQNDINVLDFRVPKGVGSCFSTIGQDMQSVFACGDMIITGGMSRASNECRMQQWSVRKARPVCTYAFPSSATHYTHLSLTQVWGSAGAVMAVNGNGLHIFKGCKDSADGQCCLTEEVKDLRGTQDLFNPSFDYAHSQVLLISRDRPASWCYWPQ